MRNIVYTVFPKTEEVDLDAYIDQVTPADIFVFHAAEL